MDDIKLRNNSYFILTFPFPVNRKKLNQRYRLLADIINFVFEKYNNHEIIISCHDDRDVFVASELFPEKKIFFSNYPQKYFDFYKKASIVLGSRLHAGILAANYGVPFININVDIRGQTFSETFGLENWNLNYNDKDLKGKLLNRINLILNNKLESFQKFIKIKKELRKKYNITIQKIANAIKKRITS